MTSVLQTSPPSAPPGSMPVTVRQTPLTAIESPRATPSSTRAARMRRTAEPARSSRTQRVPTSSTIPVNTSTPSMCVLSTPSVPGGAQSDLHVPAHPDDIDDRQGERVGDGADSQVTHEGGPGTEERRCEVHHHLVHEPGPEEGRGQ